MYVMTKGLTGVMTPGNVGVMTPQEDLMGTLAMRVASVAYPKAEWRKTLDDASNCACVHSCAEDPGTACSLSGQFHVHAGEPCEVHPDAPGDR